jgi:hypothetical protein
MYGGSLGSFDDENKRLGEEKAPTPAAAIDNSHYLPLHAPGEHPHSHNFSQSSNFISPKTEKARSKDSVKSLMLIDASNARG